MIGGGSGHCTGEVNSKDWSLVVYFSFRLMPVGRGGDSCVTTDQVLFSKNREVREAASVTL